MAKKQTAPLPGNEAAVNPEITQKVNAIVLQAKEAGVPAIVIAFKDAKTAAPIVHFENIPVSDANSLMGFGWIQSLRMELSLHPEYEKKYAAIFESAIKDFIALTKNINTQVEEYRAKHKQPQPRKK